MGSLEKMMKIEILESRDLNCCCKLISRNKLVTSAPIKTIFDFIFQI